MPKTKTKMKRRLICFSQQQENWLVKQTKILGIPVAEYIRRIIDAKIQNNKQKGNN